MGDVVLRVKLPHPLLREFSWLIELQRAWDVFALTMRKPSCPPNCGIQIGSSLKHDRNIMPVQPWINWGGKMEEKSNPQIRRSCQETVTQVSGDWKGGTVEAVLMWFDQSEKTWLWCHSELTDPGTWRVLRMLLPGLLLLQPSQPKRNKLEASAPVLCGTILFNLVLITQGRYGKSTRVTWAHRLGDSSLHS
jgi:hypothetical protein